MERGERRSSGAGAARNARGPAMTLLQIFRIPMIVLVVSLAGLGLTLVVEGPLDIAAGIAAGVPIAVIARALLRGRRRVRKEPTTSAAVSLSRDDTNMKGISCRAEDRRD